MRQVTRATLALIACKTGAGLTAQGFDLFDLPELRRLADIPVERLHRLYSYESAVCYLARLVPEDASAIAAETRVDLSVK